MEKWFQNKSFSTEKQEQGIVRKAHRATNARKIHRALGVLLAAALVFQAVPFEGIAVSASESGGGGLCEHHRSHTPDCGYKEAEPGQACTHEHTEDCYRTVEGEDGSTTKELDCHHEHDESCGYREAAEGSPCTFVCEICSGGTDKIPEDKMDDNEINDGESENPGTQNGDEVKEPDDGQEECTCEELCTEDSINTDCPVCGAEDASLSDCKGKDTEDSTEDAEENTDQPEDTGLCKHHREHDDACGYLPESEDSEGSSCTYECRICPIEKLIAALPDKVTEDNADEVRARLDEILALFSELTEDEQEQIDLSRCYELQGALDGANDPAPITESVEYQEASWDGSQVTYESKTETCTLVENSAEAVTWTAGWYAVSGTVTIDQPITVTGAVNLILTDGCTLTAAKGIVVTDGNSLTIYAQSENGGTLNATGTTDDSGNASAGIGGGTSSLASGSITIHGGVINAAGGYGKNMGGSGAGIGGGGSGSIDGDGGDSGAITIFDGVITAVGGELDYDKQIAAYHSGAGIGGGSSRNNSGGAGNLITIYGGTVTAKSQAYHNSGAGIGGGAANKKGGAGNSIAIYGGNITATSDRGDGIGGAGIGGGGGNESGDGTITISGGIVTAVGDNYAAGIGGGGGYQYSNQWASDSITGGTGSVTITGGIVDASSPTDVDYADYKGAPIGNGGNTNGTATVNKTTGIIFENGAGTVCGNVTFNGSYNVPADYSLHIPVNASLSGSGTLSGGGTFTTDLSEDMISVPEDLYYDGTDRTAELQNDLSAELNKGIEICGQTFTVSGWTLAVAKAADSDLTYTATYTNNNDNTNTFTKTITLQKSGTDLTSEGKVQTYKGDTLTKDFTASDTITVKATPTATGEAPANSAMFAASFTAPAAGQMAVFVNDTQVSVPADKGTDGSYTMTVSAADVLTNGQAGQDNRYTLIVRFVENTNMAGAEAQAEVTVTPNPLTEGMVTLSEESATYDGTEQKPIVTVTALTEGTDYEVIFQDGFKNAGEYTVTVTGKGIYAGTVEKTYTIKKATPTIAWENNEVELTYTGQPADIKPTVTLVSGEAFSGTITYKYGVYSGPDRPTDAASYTVKASIPEQGNYTAAESGWLILYINPADQAAPSAPSATEDNIKDTSITLNTIENAEYSKDGTNWQESPEFTELSPNTQYTFYARLKEDRNHNASPSSAAASITTKKTMLNTAVVTVSGSYTYTGAAIVPSEWDVVVMLNGKPVASNQYTISATGNVNAGKATLTATAKADSDYSGSVSSTFIINRAALTVTAKPQTITYGESIATGMDQVTSAGLVGGDTLESVTLTPSTSNVPGDTITPSAAQIKNGSNEDVTANYDIVYETGKLTVSYMEPPAALLYNGDIAKGWYSGDVVITAAGYTVSDTLGGEYKDSYTISAQEGTVTKTLYFKDAAGHMSGGVEVMVKFDLTPPTGEIAVGAKWWQNVLHFISFGNYAAKEYTVTIKAEDKKGSGISKIEYAIVTGGSQYTDADTLKAANLSWKEYNSGSQPTVPVSNSQYVVYARLTDNVGNVTYISTDGILLDNTPPTVGSLSVPEDTRKDVTAGFTFTVSEAADYYYVVLPESSAAPSAEDIIVTCGGTLPEGTGTAISGTFPKGSGAVSADTPGVSVDVKNLSPNTAYTVYVTAVDRAVDITDSAEGTPAGNIAVVQNVDFTTKKTLPVITKAPAVAGTYGQSVGEMTVTGGTAQAGSTVLVGTWTVSDADKNEKPSAGTSEVTVIFKPDNANYDSVSVQASLTVSQRNLNAEGVTVSEVAGTYTYTGSEIRPPVAVDTGTPAAGIYISDSGAALTANDFTVSYSNHKDAGTASVTITGKGNYTGSVTKTFTIGKAPGREVPDVSGSMEADNEKGTYTYMITPTEGAVYRMGNDGKWQEGNVFEGITPGTSVTFYAKMPETGNYEDGTPKSITVDFPKLTPAAPALSYKADRTNPADVKVTITPVSGAEYSFDGGKTWTESNEQGGFTTSQTVVLAIRLKETDTHNQSPVQTVTVNLAKKDREAPPAFSLKVEANGETDYTVTIPATEGCEYSFDGEHWSDVNVKTGVSVGETVTGYKRYKETNDYNASSAVSAKETMPKFTVKTPVISPAGGSYTGNVSVTITCASPDAEIYYTTDGSAPGRGSTRYTGAFTVTAPATVKAIAVKEGLTDSAEASVTYTKKSDSGSGSGGNGGGNSGGNEDNGGQGSGGGGSTNPGNGSTTPPIPVIPPAENINPGNGATPGTGTTPVNPGTENTVRPGSGAGTPVQGAKQPFIKGEDGKIGWDVIRAEEEKAQEGSTINVDMNGSTVVPGDIFDSIKGKDIIITFDMGNGILWSVDGKSITTDKAGDIDFSVKSGVKTVPVDIINNVTGESYSIQISLAHEGEFGFTAVLSIGLGKENAGYTASLYYYNESTGELEFICKDQIAEDGTVSLAFTHASDYVIAIDGEQEEGDGAAEPVQPEGTDGEAGDGTAENSSVPENPGTGQTGAVWWIMIVILLLTAAIGAGVFVAVKKKGEDENGRQ